MGLIKKIYVFLLCGLCCLSAQTAAKNPTLSAILLSCPPDDRDSIRRMLSHLVLEETFGHVLMGGKPMSTTGFHKKTRDIDRLSDKSVRLELDVLWQAWLRQQHLFPSQNFVFHVDDGEDFFEIYLLNKSACLKAIEDNLSLFKTILNSDSDSETILKGILFSKSLYQDGLNGSQALYGILLGFGTENALGFERYLTQARFCLLQYDDNVNHHHRDDLTWPAFRSFSQEETASLIRKYEYQRSELQRVYASGDFLEITLSRLMTLQ